MDEELVSRVLINSEMAEDMRKVAVLLVLCGWSQGHGSYLRSDSNKFSQLRYVQLHLGVSLYMGLLWIT